MADAIDKAIKVLYGVSLAYKESQNCKLEAQYAHAAGVAMVPMMLQEDYKANGWVRAAFSSSLLNSSSLIGMGACGSLECF